MILVGLSVLAAATGEAGSRDTRRPLQNVECYTDAAKAADDAYGKYYKANWYIDLHAIVQANQVRSIEVHVGPYDGSAGGGIAASYNCASGQLTFVEQER